MGVYDEDREKEYERQFRRSKWDHWNLAEKIKYYYGPYMMPKNEPHYRSPKSFMVPPRTIKKPASPEEADTYHHRIAEKLERQNRKRTGKNLSVQFDQEDEIQKKKSGDFNLDLQPLVNDTLDTELQIDDSNSMITYLKE